VTGDTRGDKTFPFSWVAVVVVLAVTLGLVLCVDHERTRMVSNDNYDRGDDDAGDTFGRPDNNSGASIGDAQPIIAARVVGYPCSKCF
jgi:hypothetical protein